RYAGRVSRALLALVLLAAACQPASVGRGTLAGSPSVGRGTLAGFPSTPPVTFHNQIERVFQTHCQVCHRPGEVAPFSLTSYREAYARRDDIRDVVRSRYMPPWKAVPGHGEFADVRRLSDAEIDLIARWVAADAPEGDPRDAPAPRMFPSGWTLGTPGAV